MSRGEWVGSAKMSNLLLKSDRAVRKQATKAASLGQKFLTIDKKNFSYRFSGGVGGGGRVLQIWSQPLTPLEVEALEASSKEGVKELPSLEEIPPSIKESTPAPPPPLKESELVAGAGESLPFEALPVSTPCFQPSPHSPKEIKESPPPPPPKGSKRAGVSPSLDRESLSYFELDESQKAQANERVRLLKEWEEYKKGGIATAKFCDKKNRLDPHLRLSERKLYRWARDYKRQGIVALADRRGKARAGKTTLKPWMQEFCLQQFRAFGAGGINYFQLWDSLHEEAWRRGECDYIKFLKKEEKPLCAYSTIKRFIDTYYQNNHLEYVMVRLGEDKAKSYLQPAMGNQKELITRRNQCWQIDSSPLDAMVRDGEEGVAFRPHILSIVDVFSGRSVMSLERSSNALSLVRLIWKAFEKLGKPEYIKGDNGKDYLSKQFQELLNGLGIDYDRAIAYSGDEKGFVERHFKTVQHSGISFTPGYIGNSLAKREVIEQRTPKRERQAKDAFGHTKKTNQEHLLTFAQMQLRLETEVAKWDIMRARRHHESPMDRWNSDPTPIKQVGYEEFILYAGGAEIRTVGKKGIAYEALCFVGDAFPPVGSKVVVRENIDNAREIFVFDLSGKFICRGYDKEIAPMSAEQYKAVKKVFKEDMRQIRAIIKSAEFSAFTRLTIQDDLERMLEAHKESLKPQSFEVANSDMVAQVREKLREQRAVDSIKGRSFDIDALPSLEAPKRPKLSWDSVIDKAVSGG